MSETLTLSELRKAVTENAAAFRCRRRLQPAGGDGDKMFPPTFAGAVYAVEQRRVPGRDQPVTCVVLDTVQSQANRMEQALQDAVYADHFTIPMVAVDFSGSDPTGNLDKDREEGRLIDPVGTVTSLQVPHRLADAILRDSEHNGVAFRASEVGRSLNTASPLNATPILALCPTALVFGMWDSTGPKGGLGPKFERAVVSEVVGIGAEFGIKTQSRIDPIISKTAGIVLYKDREGGWTLEEGQAAVEKGKPVKLGKDGKMSEANLGNVTPGFHKYARGPEGIDPLTGESAREGRIAPGGVTIDYAEQVTTLSLICLRRLRFPVKDGAIDPAVDASARMVLAALGLCAATLAFEAGLGLRSRCLLWPDAPMEWELLDRPGEAPRSFTLTGEQAVALLRDAVEAMDSRLPWRTEPITLKPSAKLLELVRRSQIEATKEDAGQGA